MSERELENKMQGSSMVGGPGLVPLLGRRGAEAIEGFRAYRVVSIGRLVRADLARAS